MCGRYRLSRRKQLVAEYFDCVSDAPDWSPRYNIAPTQPIPVIRQNPKEPVRELSLLRWGLIPSWAKDSSVAAKMINARSETAATKPAFRDALKSRRCLIPADGFLRILTYDWDRLGGGNVIAGTPVLFVGNAAEIFLDYLLSARQSVASAHRVPQVGFGHSLLSSSKAEASCNHSGRP